MLILDSETSHCYIGGVATQQPARYDLKELAARGGVTARTIHFYIAQGLLPPAGQPGPGARYSEAHLARLILIRRLQREHLPLAEIRNRLRALDEDAVLELASSVRPEPVEGRTSPEPEATTASRHSSALDYIRGVLGQSPKRGEELPARPASPAPPNSRFLVRALEALRSEDSQARRAWVEPEETRSSPAAAGRGQAPPATGAAAPRSGEGARDAGEQVAPPASAPPLVAEELRRGKPAASAPVMERSQWDRLILSSDIELHIRRPLTRDQNKRVERLVQAAREILTEGDV